jgi:hypothetical protein
MSIANHFFIIFVEKNTMFKVGDKIKKPSGYSFDGIIVAIFHTTKGEVRIVAELEGNGMLHIFNPTQLQLR